MKLNPMAQHLELALRQVGRVGVRARGARRVAHRAEQVARDPGADRRAAARDLAQRRGDLGVRVALQEVAERARADRRDDVLLVAEHGDHERHDARVRGGADQLDAAAVGQAEVGEQQRRALGAQRVAARGGGMAAARTRRGRDGASVRAASSSTNTTDKAIEKSLLRGARG
jgi:hypothetical protein